MLKKIRFTFKQEYVIICFILLLSIMFALVPGSQFASLSNLRIILSQLALNGICVIGMTLCVIMGGVDFSAGAILAACACFAGIMVNAGLPVILVMLLSILVGAICGAFSGYLIGRLKIAPIIATLASMYILRGCTTIVTGGVWISDFPNRFKWPGQTVLFGIPIHFLLFVVLAFAAQYILLNFNIGRKLYACGGGPEASRLFGLNYSLYRFGAYTISGALIGLVGTIYASMVGTVSANTTGLNTSGDLLAAALIGGVSINGGKGNVAGACLGMFLMQIIRNGLIISKISEHWADAVTGIIIIVALVLNVFETWQVEKDGVRI